MRYLCNWYYEDYYKKLNRIPIQGRELSTEEKKYYSEVEYYKNFIRPSMGQGNSRKVLGYDIKSLSEFT